MRKLILMALLAALGAFAISASGAAAAEELPSAAPPAVGAEVAPSAGHAGVVVPITASQMSPLSLEQCPQGSMCIWSNNDFTGSFSHWPGPETGCHSHTGIPKIKSAWNRTGYEVRMGGGPVLKSGDALIVRAGENPITGEVCWPA